MADERIPVTYSYIPKTKEIRRKKGKGDEIVEDKVVAHYDAETQTVIVPSLSYLRNYKAGITTFLAENEMPVRSFQRGDLEPDKPLTKATPPRPKKNKHEGDKTPEVVEWYMTYRPNEFATRYGVLGRYTGPVEMLVPVWEPRPVDNIPEYRGEQRTKITVRNALVATRAVCGTDGKRLTYLPDECVDWEDEDVEPGDEREPEPAAAAGKEDES